MADRNVSKSPPGSLSPDVFRSHPPSFEAAGQQHSKIGARSSGHAPPCTRPRTRTRARASPSCRRYLARRHAHAAHAPTRARRPAHARLADAHAHARLADARTRASPRAPALRPSCRRHDARKSRNLGPRQPPDRAPRPPRRRGDGRRWPPRPPRSGPRERLATDLHGGSRPKHDASAENGTLAEFSGVSQYPCRTPEGDRGVAGLFSVGPPGDGYPMATLFSHRAGCRGAASAHPHTPLYARAVNRAEDCLCFKQNLLKSVKRS